MSNAMMRPKAQNSNSPEAAKSGETSPTSERTPNLGGYDAQRQALASSASGYALQLAALSPAPPDMGPTGMAEMAARGTGGSGGALPHKAAIQRSFGRHDVSGIRAHTGGAANAASQAMGARGYAYGDAVAFAGTPDLHTAAHEAAHFFHQQAGVQLAGGVGQVGDAYEQHADAVADAVVRGESAEALLDPYAGGSASAASVQLKPVDTMVSNLAARETVEGDEFVAKWARTIREDARDLVRPWIGIRKNPESELPKGTKTGLSGFLRHQRSAMMKALPTTGQAADAVIDQAIAQAKSELVKGTFVQYLTEIRLLHRTGHDLCEWLDIEVDDDCHSYALEVETLAGVSGSVGPGAGLSGKTYKVSYSNKVLPNLDWDHSFATAELSVSGGTPGINATAGGTANYRALPTRDYHGPSWFTEDAGLTTLQIEASASLGVAAVVGDSVVMFSDGVQGVSFVSAGSKLSQRIQVDIPEGGLPKNVADLKTMFKGELGISLSISLLEVIVDEHDRPESWAIGDPSGEFDVEAEDVPGTELLMHHGDFYFDAGESELTESHLKKVDLLVKRMNDKTYQPLDTEFKVNVTGLASARWDAIEKRVVALEERYEAGKVTTEQYREKRDELIAEKRVKNEELASLRAQNTVWALSDRLDLPDVKLDRSLIDAAMEDQDYTTGLEGRIGAGDFSSEAKDQRVQIDVVYTLKDQQG